MRVTRCCSGQDVWDCRVDIDGQGDVAIATVESDGETELYARAISVKNPLHQRVLLEEIKAHFRAEYPRYTALSYHNDGDIISESI